MNSRGGEITGLHQSVAITPKAAPSSVMFGEPDIPRLISASPSVIDPGRESERAIFAARQAMRSARGDDLYRCLSGIEWSSEHVALTDARAEFANSMRMWFDFFDTATDPVFALNPVAESDFPAAEWKIAMGLLVRDRESPYYVDAEKVKANHVALEGVVEEGVRAATWPQRHKQCSNCGCTPTFRRYGNRGYCGLCYSMVTRIAELKGWERTKPVALKGSVLDPLMADHYTDEEIEIFRHEYIRQAEERLAEPTRTSTNAERTGAYRRCGTGAQICAVACCGSPERQAGSQCRLPCPAVWRGTASNSIRSFRRH
jgi:hypothetical protein